MKARVSEVNGELRLAMPPDVAASAGIAAGMEVAITVEDGAIVIRREAAIPDSLRELLANVTPENRHAETDWGLPMGSEAW